MQNNIKFGHSQYLTNKNVNLFLFQTKKDIEFFDTIDLKNILYKIFLYIKTIYSICKKQNSFLFATTTSAYSEIIKNAALSSNTVYHVDRWTCGTITRNINDWPNTNFIDIIKLTSQKNLFNFCYFFFRYKKLLKDRLITNYLIGLFIPDPQNNLMIVKEAKIQNLPLIGIINSNSYIDINYPIFGNNKSLFSVFFFSNLIAYWIKTYMRFYHEKKSFFVLKKKSKKTKNIKKNKQIQYYKLFQKRYMKVISLFQKSLKKDHLYNTFISQLDSRNINNYKKKLKIQQKTRIVQDDLFFSYKDTLDSRIRWTIFIQNVRSNLSGGISVTKNFFGRRFWLIFRNFLNDTTDKRYRFSKALTWSKRKKFNWKWSKFGKKKLLKIKNLKKLRRKNKQSYTYPKKYKIKPYKNQKKIYSKVPWIKKKFLKH